MYNIGSVFLYNLSEFFKQLKSDVGIKDIPLPVHDREMVERFLTSALVEFSVRYPLLDEIVIEQSSAINTCDMNTYGNITYVIPPDYYKGTAIATITGINPNAFGAGANMYMPNVVLGSADVMMSAITDIQMAATLGSLMAHAPTFKFFPPNKLVVYNGWTATSYRVEVGYVHDSSLCTVPVGAFTNLRELAMLDTREFLYNKLNRVTGLNLGVGEIDLKIDNWESAGQEKRDLLKQWDESINLSLDRIAYF